MEVGEEEEAKKLHSSRMAASGAEARPAPRMHSCRGMLPRSVLVCDCAPLTAHIPRLLSACKIMAPKLYNNEWAMTVPVR